MEKSKLHLSSNNKMIGGVCAGLAECLGIDVSIARIGAVLCFIAGNVLTVIIYILLWAVLPIE